MAAVKKPHAGQWKKGVSPNPGGRPKGVAHVRAIARSYTREAIETLVEIMTDRDCAPAPRVAAANAILDRGYGKPLQSHVQLSDVPDDELTVEVKRRLELVDGEPH